MKAASASWLRCLGSLLCFSMITYATNCGPPDRSGSEIQKRAATGIIVFSVTPPNGDNELFVIGEDGTGLVQLANHEGRDAGPEYSPDGSMIAFYAHTSDEKTWSIFVMNADGSGIVRLTESEGIFDSSPVWSPDGSKIAFSREYPSEGFRGEIWIMNADGSDKRMIAGGSAVDWSPDGKRFVYVQTADGNPEIHTMNIDGSGGVRLTNNEGEDYWPDWSPDGSKIAFQSERDGNMEIYVMKSDGSDQRRLTNNAAADLRPDWSPDGSKIAFVSSRDGNFEIYVMNADGTGQRRLTETSVDAIQPAWKPVLQGTGGL
jgi:Tol biopolymer transport system component